MESVLLLHAASESRGDARLRPLGAAPFTAPTVTFSQASVQKLLSCKESTPPVMMNRSTGFCTGVENVNVAV